MARVFSNGPSQDFVYNPFQRMLLKSTICYVASPYVTLTKDLVTAAHRGTSVNLLAGLNAITSPEALKAAQGIPNLAIRYLTHRFHAKIYLFDASALVGSSNLTQPGLMLNREATICLDQPEDFDTIEELRTLFAELWDSARVLTGDTLKAFAIAHASAKSLGPDPDALIEEAVGRAEPQNVHVASTQKSPERIFIEGLRRQVVEQYKPSYDEVTKLLVENNLRRPELHGIGIDNETNRFLYWLRETHAAGDEAWQSASVQSLEHRRADILRYGHEWKTTNKPEVSHDYLNMLQRVQEVFASREAIATASKDDLTEGLMSIHAFQERLRFTAGGKSQVPVVFWKANNDNVAKVKETLTYLLFGPGDFILRLHDVLYTSRKLAFFGLFNSLELFGTIKPEQCPPMNGRMAKALKFLGFTVKAT